MSFIFGSHNVELFKSLLKNNKQSYNSYGVFQYDIDNNVKIITSNTEDISNHIHKSEVYYLGYMGESSDSPQPDYYKEYYYAYCGSLDDKLFDNESISRENKEKKNLGNLVFRRGFTKDIGCSFWLYNKSTLELVLSTYGEPIYTDGSSFSSKFVDNWDVLAYNCYWTLNYTKKSYEFKET